MGLEKILHRVAGAFSDKKLKPAALNDAVFEVPPVNPEDITKQGQWKNNEGKRIRIDLKRGVYTEYPGGQEFYTDAQSVQELLEREGYVFAPAAVEVSVDPVAEQAPEKKVSQEIPQEIPQPTDQQVDKIIQDDQAVEQSLEGMSARVELINVALSEAQEIVDKGHFQPMQSIIDEIAERVTAVVETANELSATDDVADELAAQEGTLSGNDTVTKQARLEKLRSLSQEIELLEQHATTALKSLKKLDTDAASPNAVSMDASAENPGHGKDTAISDRKKRSVRKKGGDGGDGRDDTGEDDQSDRTAGKGKKRPDKARLFEAKRNGDVPPLPTGNLETLLQNQTVSPQPEVPREELVVKRDQPALKEFLKRPEGQEVIDTYRIILMGEWEKFTETLGRSKKMIPHDKAVDIWEQDARFLPLVRARLEADLMEKHGVEQAQARDIFLDILQGLDEEYRQKRQSGSGSF